jgi:hypothetical protein
MRQNRVLAEIGHSQIQNRPLFKADFNGLGGLRTYIRIVPDVSPGTSKVRPQLAPAGPFLLAAPEAALLRLVTDPGDEPRAAPKLNGRTFGKPLGSFDSFAVGKELSGSSDD